jgi:hypothetical protein
MNESKPTGGWNESKPPHFVEHLNNLESNNMQVGEPVKVITGLTIGSTGTLVEIKQPGTYMVKFQDFEHPQAYFKWELSQNGVFPPRDVPETDLVNIAQID